MGIRKLQNFPVIPRMAVIFDLDGVLVSTDRYHRQAWQRLAGELGVPFNDDKARRTRGVDRKTSLQVVLGPRHEFSPREMERLAARKNMYYMKLISGITPRDILPGALELMSEIDEHGIPMAVGSASRNARKVLELLGISQRFAAIVTGHDFERGKPAPDVFLVAARRLGVPPERCVVFEDAGAGVRAALAGGMKVVGVGSPDIVCGADRIVNSLAEISYSDLMVVLRDQSPRGA